MSEDRTWGDWVELEHPDKVLGFAYTIVDSVDPGGAQTREQLVRSVAESIKRFNVPDEGYADTMNTNQILARMLTQGMERCVIRKVIGEHPLAMTVVVAGGDACRKLEQAMTLADAHHG